MPQPSEERSVTPEVRRYQQVYCNQRHDTLGYKLLDYERNEMNTVSSGRDSGIEIDPNHINTHEGQKYLRTIVSATQQDEMIEVDVYEVLLAFNVSDPAIAHAVKKLLCCGQRGKGDAISDLNGAIAAIKRAINFRERKFKFEMIQESGT